MGVRICDNSNVADIVYFPYFIIPSLGVEERLLPKLRLAPNPAVSKVMLTLENSNVGLKHLTLFTLAGKEVIVPQENLEGKLEFNVADLASGVYLVKVQLSDDTVITKRLIKQ